ncbi:uncharacterized protein LOC18432268 isoform X3 [Amborella trichopoda]|uniref:uncharacterized protein LOC18432268 isoform X3 n=1 Tax=Amborella trichopoda TaxID=13333 RepID=UPI0009BF37BC|nr:uncharacterized protein LOC18432268 isoform X3 [Amborella trichopoda]|eukprot:XP_020521828.1 uncharacterized protein LOC18432268 isoform X3 [Amborella trichopoda]
MIISHLSNSPHPSSLPPAPTPKSPTKIPKQNPIPNASPIPNSHTERGLKFTVGDSFFRHESCAGRDLGVLAAALYKKTKGNLRVLDAMCGCGIRSLRYLSQANADFVWANDGNEEQRNTILSNLKQEHRFWKHGFDRAHQSRGYGGDGNGGSDGSLKNRVFDNGSLQIGVSDDGYDEFQRIRDFGEDGSQEFNLCNDHSQSKPSGEDGFSRSHEIGVFREDGHNCSQGSGVLREDGRDGSRGCDNFSERNIGFEDRRWVVTHFDATRLLVERYLQRDYYDLIDIDSFGSDTTFLQSAFSSMKLGGLMYITSTDGYSSGGHRPYHHYGFISYCNKCGDSQAFSWDDLGQMCCACSNNHVRLSCVCYTVISHGDSLSLSLSLIARALIQHFLGLSQVSHSLVVSGPLWTGPLHEPVTINNMLDLANQWGWIGPDSGDTHLEKLMKMMLAECDPRLPFGYIKLDEVSRRAKLNTPGVNAMMNILHQEGFAVSRSHIEANAIKTNCPMTTCIQFAKQLKGH